MTSVAQQQGPAQGYSKPGLSGATRTPAPTEDEADMVERARRGENEAFDWLYRRHHTAIFNFVYRLMGNHHDAEELTADAFLKAWLALPQTTPDLKFSAWLYRVATNRCLDELRHRKLVKWQPWEAFISVFHPSQVASAREQPERLAIHREDTEEVGMLLGQLHPRYRSMLLLREYYDLSYDEIAEVLFTTRAAVKSLLFRAREEFRALYARSPLQPGRATGDESTGRRLKGQHARHVGGQIVARREALGLSQRQIVLRLRSSHDRMSLLERDGRATEEFLARVRRCLDDLEAEASSRNESLVERAQELRARPLAGAS